MGVARKIFAISACIWLANGTARADFVGLNIGSSPWAPAPYTSFNNSDSDSFDVVDDLDLENPEQSSVALIFEHPITALPNFRYQGYELDSSDYSRFPSDLRLNGELLNSGNGITSSIDLTQDDILLYYQLPSSNRVNLDLGVDLKRFDGEILLDGTDSTRVSVNETIPLLFLSARYDMSNSGFYVGAHINANIVDLGVSDSTAQIRRHLPERLFQLLIPAEISANLQFLIRVLSDSLLRLRITG
jgi:outer membrane protein